MTQTEDYNEKEGTEELNNIMKTSNFYTIPIVSYNANHKTWSIDQLLVDYVHYLGYTQVMNLPGHRSN